MVQLKTKELFFTGIILSVIVSLSPSAAANDPDTRREQMRQDAQASFAEVRDTLTGILAQVNRNRRPDAAQIQDAADLLETNRRNAVSYDNAQRAVYMLLQSWVAYYQDDPAGNMNWASRACREDMTNGDAWISQTLFSFIYGRRPIEPQPPRPQRAQPERRPQQQRPQPRTRPGETTMESPAVMYSAEAPYGRPGTLDFDLNMLRRDMMRERFIRQEYLTADNKKVVYTPGRDILCILFWQAEETVDPNTHAGAATPAPAATDTPMMQADARYNLETQQLYFKALVDALADKSHVKFVEVNTNSAAVSREAIKDYKPSAPLVIAATPQSGAMQFARMDVPVPFLAIVDQEGQVKYAGVLDGFLPAFILSHLTGATIELADSPAAARGHGTDSLWPVTMPVTMPDPMAAPMMAPPPLTPVDPNRLPADPNQPSASYRQLPLEQEVEAEKKLVYARDLFGQAARLPVVSYRNFVVVCREIIRDYPGTRYAAEARKLLAQVPERHRATYNITPAELGE